MKKEYKTEEEFLKDYNPKDYDQLSMTSDILLISVSNQEQTNYRKTSKKMMSILLVKRDDYPYKDKWCLPGGFLNPKTETLEECAKRVLKKETNLSNIYLEQLYTYDAIDRDPRTRVVSTTYIALIDKNKLTENNIRFIVEKTLYNILEEGRNRHYVKKVLFYPYDALFDEISDQEISEMEDAGIKESYTVWINRYFEADTYVPLPRRRSSKPSLSSTLVAWRTV